MRGRLSAAVGVFLLLGCTPLHAQDHGPAPAPKALAEPLKSVPVTPAVPAAKVAEAIAEALRAAEAAEARRAAKVAIRPILPRRPSPPSGPAKRYEVRWRDQRMVFYW
jgi:hypothetical protein